MQEFVRASDTHDFIQGDRGDQEINASVGSEGVESALEDQSAEEGRA